MTAQTDLILAHLKTGRKITPLDALEIYGCFRLGARIWDLKRRGIAIKSEIIEDKKTKKHFAEYSLR